MGWASFGASLEAGIWSGTAGSWVSLHPSSVLYSVGRDTDGVTQVGAAITDPNTLLGRACLWTGTAGSYVDLQPTGASQSMAIALDGGKQYGSATFGGSERGGFWSGTAASWTSLHPGGWSDSRVNCAQGGEQVGVVTNSSNNVHAGLWTGTAGSFVDLNPSGGSDSAATGVFGGIQCGWANFGNPFTRAGIWTGTASSWVDLHAVLPSSYLLSYAEDVWTNGTQTVVVGTAYHLPSGQDHAMMWVIPSPGGMGLAVAAGLLGARRRRR